MALTKMLNPSAKMIHKNNSYKKTTITVNFIRMLMLAGTRMILVRVRII